MEFSYWVQSKILVQREVPSVEVSFTYARYNKGADSVTVRRLFDGAFQDRED